MKYKRGRTWSLCLDNGLGRDADPPVIQWQLAAGKVVRPAVVVVPHHRLTASLGPLAHGFARLDGLMLEVDGADGRVHGAQEEQQVGTAAGTLTGMGAEMRPSSGSQQNPTQGASVIFAV